MIFSSAGIQESMRWQLAKKTHLPSASPSSIIFTATGAWPVDHQPTHKA